MKIKKLILIALIPISIAYCYKVVYKAPGQDFNVFYLAWELFANGDADKIYNDQGLLGVRYGGALPEGLTGTDHTRAGPFLYPATFAMIFSPLGFLPHNIAEIIWFYLNLISLFLVFFIIYKQVNNVPWHFAFVLFLLIGRFVFRSLEYGQVNVLIMSGIFFSFYFYYLDKKNISALILALVTSWKIAPAIIILYFIWKRDYKYAFRFVALVSSLLLAPALFIGLKANATLLFTLYKQLSSFVLQTDATNQSIAAMTTRFFTDITVKVHSQGSPINVMIAELGKQAASYITLTIQFFVIIASFFVIKHSNNKDFKGIVFFDAGLMSLLMLLFTHLMWRATLVHLLLPQAALLYIIYTQKVSKAFIVFFAISIFLNTFTSQGFMGARLSDWFSAYSSMCIATLIIFCLLIVSFLKQTNNKSINNE